MFLERLERVTMEEVKEGVYFAVIPFEDVDKLLCRGRHLLHTLWVLRFVEKTAKKADSWFYVEPKIVERFNGNMKDWYRCIQQLKELEIISVRYKSGYRGMSLYRFGYKTI